MTASQAQLPQLPCSAAGSSDAIRSFSVISFPGLVLLSEFCVSVQLGICPGLEDEQVSTEGSVRLQAPVQAGTVGLCEGVPGQAECAARSSADTLALQ